MAHHTDAGIETFRADFSGQVLTLGHPDYDGSRALWNGAIDRKPAVIARCTTAEQVADAIRFARGSGLEIAVRGGGHSYAGNSVCDDGLMIHLGAMNSVVVDAAARRAVCGGGATWADVDAATQQHGLATPGGFISHTGIAGLTLGGGIGWLTQEGRAVLRQPRRRRGGDGRLAHRACIEGTTTPNSSGRCAAAAATSASSPRSSSRCTRWARWSTSGCSSSVSTNGPQALRFARDYIKTLPAEATAFLAIGLSAPPAPFVPGAVSGPARARAARRGLWVARRAPGHGGADPQSRDAIVRAGDADSVRRAAADVQRRAQCGERSATRRPCTSMSCRMPPSRSSASMYRRRARRCRSARPSPCPVPTAHPRRRHGLRRQPQRGLRVQHRRRRPHARAVRSRSLVGAQLLGCDAAARDRLGRLRELHGRGRRRARARCRTARPSTSAWRASRPSTTPTTSFTSTPTSNRPRCQPDRGVQDWIADRYGHRGRTGTSHRLRQPSETRSCERCLLLGRIMSRRVIVHARPPLPPNEA